MVKLIKHVAKFILGVGIIVFMDQILKVIDPNVGDSWFLVMDFSWVGYIANSYFIDENT